MIKLKAWRIALGIGFSVACVACASMHRETIGGWMGAQPVISNAKIYVLMAPDGVEREEGPAIGSGAAMTAAIREQLIRHGYTVVPGKETSAELALPAATTAQTTYILVSTPTEWEDNLTEWSGKPDRAGLYVELYEVPSGQLVSTAKHRVVSSTSAWVSRETDRFIPELVDQALAKLFGWQPTVATQQ